MNKTSTKKTITLLVGLCLVTSCFVGSTLAKYTTRVTGSDTARVAKFGVELTAATDLFKAKYVDGAVTVQSDENADGSYDDVIAPGTTGTATAFTISGAPEVDVKVTVGLSGLDSQTADDLTMAKLPAGDYTDYTVVVDNNNDGVAEEYNNFTLADDYYPVKWKLEKDGAVVVDANGDNLENVTLDVIHTYLTDELSGDYDVESDAFDEINGDYVLTWDWDYEVDSDTDVADTFMGQVAAGIEGAPAGYVADEAFNLYLEVTQID